jgi:hypothetical protein
MVILEILSPMSLKSREDGRVILDLWRMYLPELLPDFYGNWEPVDRPFNRQAIDVALDQWKWPFLATRKSPSVDAAIWMRKGERQQLHSTVIFRMQPGAATQAQLLDFLRAASSALRADFGCLHLLTSAESERGRANHTVSALDRQGTKFNFFIASKDLQKRLPDLYWATVMGAPYLDMFGRDCLLSSPTHSIEAISNQSVLLQLTGALTDVENTQTSFAEARKCVMAHLDPDAFFQPEMRPSHRYRAPRFCFT